MFRAFFGRGDSYDARISKKFDSPRMQPTNKTMSMSTMTWSGLRRRRLLLGLGVALAIYLFVRNLPTDLPPVAQRYNRNFGSMASGHSQAQLNRQPQPQSQSQSQSQVKSPGDAYEGPIRYPQLAESLQNAASTSFKDNVVFAIPHLTSAAKLLPLACQMGRRDWNTVHVVLLGRSNVALRDVLKANGITLSDCPVSWHDARPDRAVDSSDDRILKSVQSAITLVNRALLPSAVLTDEATRAESELTTAIEKTTAKLGVSLITLPKHALQDMAWITMLEGKSLKRFRDIQIDIVIQPYSQSAGSLLKLMRSIRNANYHGLPLPRLTIELPPDADPLVLKSLSKFRWPPRSRLGESKLNVRRRVNPKLAGLTEAALRTVESFYPVEPSTSHVLFLNPDIELSPNFMHYLMLTILEFKYGTRSNLNEPNLFGIALELPSEKPDGSVPFIELAITKASPLVLSQSPNSNAALYFGDRWIEFHAFLSKRLERDAQLKKKTMKGDSAISKHYPTWLTHAHEVMRARGWLMLYPGFSRSDKDHIAVLHTELKHDPPELLDLDDAKSTTPVTSNSKDGKSLPVDFDAEQIAEPVAVAVPFTLPSFMSVEKDRLPTLSELPLLSASGKITDWPSLAKETTKYANDFSLHFGGCPSLETARSGGEATVESLFCEDPR